MYVMSCVKELISYCSKRNGKFCVGKDLLVQFFTVD